jgi:hypothetical protein
MQQSRKKPKFIIFKSLNLYNYDSTTNLSFSRTIINVDMTVKCRVDIYIRSGLIFKIRFTFKLCKKISGKIIYCDVYTH